MSSGADNIVSSIMSEAQGKVDEIIQKASTEAATITDKGEKTAQSTKAKMLDESQKQANMRYQQLISEAKMNARRAKLEAREQLIEESFEKAKADLNEIASSSSDEYKNSLTKIIKEAAIEVGGGDLIVSVKSEDVEKAKASLPLITKEVSDVTGVTTNLLFGENINTIGGAIVKTKNGEIEVNNTIESRLERFKKSLRSEVAKVLFD
jgi:V/A-type H+-transporting ATPase subunit E